MPYVESSRMGVVTDRIVLRIDFLGSLPARRSIRRVRSELLFVPFPLQRTPKKFLGTPCLFSLLNLPRLPIILNPLNPPHHLSPIPPNQNRTNPQTSPSIQQPNPISYGHTRALTFLDSQGTPINTKCKNWVLRIMHKTRTRRRKQEIENYEIRAE